MRTGTSPVGSSPVHRPSLLSALFGTTLLAAACGGEGPKVAPTPPPPVLPSNLPHQSGVALDGLLTRNHGDACVECHADVVEAYTSSGMFDALTLPAGDGSVEAAHVGAEVVHEPTGMRVLFTARDGRYVQRLRYLDPAGVERAYHESPVDLVVGSGHAARSYFHVRDGQVFQLPLTWFSETGRLALSPGGGFEDDAIRFAPRLCVACHAGDVTPRAAGEELGFHGEVSLGISCARCHGDAASHCETGDPAEIVNPARLPVERQSEICYQCHMSGTAMLKPRAVFSGYQPGRPLGEVMGIFLPQGGGAGKTGIASHARRLEASRCFREGADMTCTTCHDPHEGHRSDKAGQEARRGCLVCHDRDSCGEAHDVRGERACADCHMARVPSADVVHTRTTDHWIQRRPVVFPAEKTGGPLELARAAAAGLPLTNALDPTDELPGSVLLKARAYLMGAETGTNLLRADVTGYVQAAARLVEQQLAAVPGDVDALVLRARILRHSEQYALALQAAEAALRSDPASHAALTQAALSEGSMGRREPAVARLRAAWDLYPTAEHVPRALCDMLVALGRPAEALDVFDEMRRRLGPSLQRALGAARVAAACGLEGRGLPHAYDVLMFRPREPEFLVLAAELCRRSEQPPEQARVLFEEALLRDDRSVPALLGLAHLALEGRDAPRAREFARRAAAIAPGAPAVRDLLRRL